MKIGSQLHTDMLYLCLQGHWWKLPLRRSHACIISWARIEPVNNLKWWYFSCCEDPKTQDMEQIAWKQLYLGRPYKMRMAVTSHLRSSLQGSGNMSVIWYSPILGRFHIWSFWVKVKNNDILTTLINGIFRSLRKMLIPC